MVLESFGPSTANRPQQLVEAWKEKPTKITLAGSFVSKFQPASSVTSDTLILSMPQNVGSWSYRARVQRRAGWRSGYVKKINDPNADNNYTYRKASFLASYSQKGLGMLLSAKMVDNMSFRSDRDMRLFDLPVNFIPCHTASPTTLRRPCIPRHGHLWRDECLGRVVLHDSQGQQAWRQVRHQVDRELFGSQQPGHDAIRRAP